MNEKEQRIFDIAGVKIGGRLGECPTVLIGTIFYEGHKIVSDCIKGSFDKRAAESLIRKQEEMSSLTGNPHIVDIFGSTCEALINYIDFVAGVTHAPFLVDSTSSNQRIPAMRHAIETGLRERTIYNSIDYNVKEDEIAALEEMKAKSAMILAYNPSNAWPEGRIEILRGDERKQSLLEAAEKAGIENKLVDTAVLDAPGIILAAKSIRLVKQEFGLPTGCGPSNAITTWKNVRKGLGPYAYDVCIATAAVLTQVEGANFVLYGPIGLAERAFPACAMTDALNTYYGRRYGIKPKVSNNPLSKIFR